MCAVLDEYGVTIAPSTYYAHRARGGWLAATCGRVARRVLDITEASDADA